MTNVSIRRGGMPVPSDVLVSCDGTTIGGDGSARNPIHAIGEPDTEVERSGTSAITPGDFNGTSPVAIGYSNTGIGLVQFTLADGETDGFQKSIGINPSGGATYRVNGSFPTGFTQVNFPDSGGGMLLVWDATNDTPCWQIISVNDGTPA